jgi:hypothetical protein
VDYVRARLSKESGAVCAHRRFIQNARFSSSPLPLKWFWAASIWLPLPVFRRTIDWMWGHGSQGSLRRMLLSILRFFHGRKSLSFNLS